MRAIERTTRFRRDFRRVAKGRHGDLLEAALTEVLDDLLHDRPPPLRLRDHALTGNWTDHRDCHLRPDLVLIYRLIDSDRLAHPRAHGLGLGRWLLLERLARIARAEPPTRWVTVDTSPRVAPFFERHGFETAGVWPHGYRAGGTMHVLRYDLAATTPAALDAAAAAAYAYALDKLA